MCDFSGPTMCNYKSLTWQGSWGEAALPKADWGPSQCTVVPEGSRRQDSGTPDWPV